MLSRAARLIPPTQASSDFITNKQQGDWAEDVLFRAINENSENIVAVRYGKSDDLVAGEEGFRELFDDYQRELDTIASVPICCCSRKKISILIWGMTSAIRTVARLASMCQELSQELKYAPVHIS